ncbi:Calcipressin, partial [Ostertagia ostertagi]
VFTNPEHKENFCQLFTQIEENIHFDFLKSFRRVRVIFRQVCCYISQIVCSRSIHHFFSTPESATAAKLIVQGFSFHGHEMKAFLAQRVILRRSSQLLSPPPLEKQFLISP